MAYSCFLIVAKHTIKPRASLGLIAGPFGEQRGNKNATNFFFSLFSIALTTAHKKKILLTCFIVVLASWQKLKKQTRRVRKGKNKNVFNYPEQRRCSTAQGFGQDGPFKTFSPLRDEPKQHYSSHTSYNKVSIGSQTITLFVCCGSCCWCCWLAGPLCD